MVASHPRAAGLVEHSHNSSRGRKERDEDTMYIRKVWIENVRGFGADEHRVELDLERPDGKFAGWTVVAGRNGAGKSTFLKALALAVAGPTVARSLVASFAGWIRDGATSGYLGVELDFYEGDGFAGGGTVNRDPLWADIELKAQAEGPDAGRCPQGGQEALHDRGRAGSILDSGAPAASLAPDRRVLLPRG